MRQPSTPEANAAAAQSRQRKSGPPPQSLPLGRAQLGEHFVVGPRVVQGTVNRPYDRGPDDPVFRPLRIYALDPSASEGEGAQAVLNVPYEPLFTSARGLYGAILEIEDDLPAPDDAAAAADGGGVDLDAPFVLMQQGVLPSPESARFRQQMAYAVCSTTYAAFRHALGREVAWGFRRAGAAGEERRLRIRPAVHGLQNAFYDAQRGEIRFGLFTASAAVSGRNVPEGRIALCLSHDVVVHEMSHALLDGLRSHFLHPSNPDVLAFHEGFADLVALFQRFTYRSVVGAAIRASRGDVSGARLLTDIGVQFAQTTDARGALRSAVDEGGQGYEDEMEPHLRGQILLSAVFEAFTRLYDRKARPLIRLATSGSGVLPPGEIPDLLATQLTDQAGRLAAQFLSICIRAIDYCPPVDLTFGEFLRAVLTADADLVPDDPWAYREAWIDAFARRRIYPGGVPSLSEGALRWRPPEQQMPPEPELSFAQLRFEGDPGRAAGAEELRRQALAFGQLAADPRYCREFGLAMPDDPALQGDTAALPVVESVRSSRRVGPNGQVVFDLVAEVTQRRSVAAKPGRPGFDFFGGATVILDPQGRVRYVVRKSVLDAVRLERQRAYVSNGGALYFGPGPGNTRLPDDRLLRTLHEQTRPMLRASAGTRSLLRGLSGTPEGEAAQRYLLRRGEERPWVPVLKACLRACLTPAPELDDSTHYDAAAERALRQLQGELGAMVDGIAGPATWTLIGRRLRAKAAVPPLDDTVPDWIRRLLLKDPRLTPPGTLDVAAVLDMAEFTYGALSERRRQGLSQLLQRLKGDAAVQDLRWAAYMLATVRHECADTWQPVEEIGKGAGKTYGKPVTVVGPDGQPRRNAYYGRGYVQITWQENYRRLGQRIGLGRQLELQPELALNPDTAYALLSVGMREGLFTGKALGDYLAGDVADYLNARRIINGTDRAALIAGYAGRFETMLLACSA